MWSHIAALGLTVVGAVPRTCADVRGQIHAQVTDIRPSLRGLRLLGSGHSDGDLAGQIELSVLKSFSAAPLNVTFEIARPDGRVRVDGQARARGSSHERPVAGELVLRGGERGWQNASGSLAASGTVNTRTRTLSVRYSGRICAPHNELIPARDDRQKQLEARA